MGSLAPTIADFVSKAMAPLRAENERLTSSLAAVEQRFADFSAARDNDRVAFIGIVQEEIAKIELPKDGKDADPEAIKAAVLDVVAEVLPGEVSAAVEKIEKPKDGIDGKDADPVDHAEVAKLLVDLIQVPKDGKDGVDGKGVTIDDVKPLLEEMVAAIQIPLPENGKDGLDGKSISVDEVLPAIEEVIEKKVAALPKARDGEPGRDGKDGIGLAGALLGRSGDLVLTLSDGTANSLGVIVGKDGEPGKPGGDGKDGLGFDDLKIIHDGERSFTFRYERGDQVKEQVFTIPAVLDRGVFKEAREKPYEQGDGVSFGGSFWIAQKDAPEGKPGDGSAAWRLSVKKGRDGKDGIVRTLPQQGPVKSS